MKECKSCNIDKNLSEFYVDKKSIDGYRSKCKLCIKEERKLYRIKNHEKITEYNKKYRKHNSKFREKIKNYQKKWRKNNSEYREKENKRRRIPEKVIMYNEKKRALNILVRKHFNKSLKKEKEQLIKNKYKNKYNNLQNEQWKQIKGYEGLYVVSNYGRVYSNVSNKMLSIIIEKTHGYSRVNLYKDGIRTTHKVHRLVATAFINNKDNKPEINHIDFDRNNNYINNLEWVTRKENNQHKLIMR